jgi:hypothetical protein
MTRQGGWVQLEQSDMHLSLIMAKMAKGEFSRAAIDKTHHQIQIPRAEVGKQKKQGGQFPGHPKGKAAIERDPTMVYINQTDGCLPCQNGTVKSPQTHWRRKGTCTPQPEPAAAPHRTPPPSGSPRAPPGDSDGPESY